MGQRPGEGDGAGGDLADPDGGRHWGSDHGHAVADAVLAVYVLHSAHHTGQTLPHGDDEEGPIRQHLVVLVVMDQLVVDKPGEPGRWVTHCAAGQGHALAVRIVNVTGEAGYPSGS